MTAEDLDALAADVGQRNASHDGCDIKDCGHRLMLELARGYLSLRLVQADHDRQIAAARADIQQRFDLEREWKRKAEQELAGRISRIAELHAELDAVREGYAALQEQYAQRVDHMAALQAAYDDVQAALMKSIANTERAQSLLLTYTNF